MKLNRHNWQPSTRDSRRATLERGVALIVTVIMLSVITFLTVAFLALMGREKGSVKIATDQTIARLASDTARERAQAELLATILATTNLANFDLLVSTNFVRWEGFDPGAVDGFTNVNYEYQSVPGNPALNAAQALRNLSSLFYNPRPPVFITNRLAGGYEFRYYNDLNRNGRPDRTGFWPTTNNLGQAIATNSVLVTNYLVGDPEWLGGLERADLPHSPSNRFAYRYSYLVAPAGKTLDVNYTHNQALAARRRMDPSGTDFFRNEGVGSWEINLAAFLYDLNTNLVHGWGLNNVGYVYDPVTGRTAGGNAFYDAAALYRYRINGNPTLLPYRLASVATLFGAPGVTAFQNDFIDGYLSGGLLLSTNGAGLPASGLTVDQDLAGRSWPGAPQTNHFFTPQDLFDPAKTDPTTGGGNKFNYRLTSAGTNVSTYDQYTFYRLLSQLGTDSAPEAPDKLNLNYVNVGGLSATNFVPWTDPDLLNGNPGRGIPRFGVPGSVLFFTNVVDRLLKTYTAEWLATEYNYFTNQFQVTRAFGMTTDTNFINIPVFVNGRMVYSPAVHRVLQMAANLWDAKPNTRAAKGLPTVFRPYFTNISGNLFISGFAEIQRTNDLPSGAAGVPFDLASTTNLSTLLNFQPDSLIYGVPLVVGTHKGLPNFNEFAMESVFTLTRKIELVKSGPGGQNKITQTNQFFTLNAYVATGAEFWNSYRSNYTRPVQILVNNFVTLALTNDNNVSVIKNVTARGAMTTNLWPLWQDGSGNDRSFMVPLRTNIALISAPIQKYLPGSGKFVDINTPGYDLDARLLFPRWGLTVTNRVQAMVVDSLGQIVDYVLLGDMNSYFDAATEIGQDPSVGDPTNPFKRLWGTNASGNKLSGRPGVYQQILVSRGSFGNVSSTEWSEEGSFTGNRAAEIAKFKAFFTPDNQATYTDPETRLVYTGSNAALRAYAPFSPSVTFTVPMSWQANDPLVHYIARDLLYVEESGQSRRIKPPGGTNFVVMENLGIKNKRYKPWPTEVTSKTDPDAFNLTLKDPLITSSDDWQFPTNVLPTIGWLGRIHRGTPWQTIYLKASDLGLQPQTYSTNLNNSTTWANVYSPFANKWSRWTGNRDLREGFLTRPVTDRVMFDEFTTAFDEISTRGQLPINQTGLAAWSALLSGVVALTNTASGRPGFSPLVIQPAGFYDSLNPKTWPALVKIVAGINRTRANPNLFPTGTFQHLGDILAVPELSVGANPALAGIVNLGSQTFQGDLYWTNVSPFLYLGEPILGANEKLDAAGSKTTPNQQKGVNDAAYEWLPQQILSLLRLGEPRFVIYAYGQTLHPAADSVLTSGPYFQMCTNYQITAEVATRAVVRVEGSPNPAHTNTFLPLAKRYPPRLVVESFNYLAPD